MDKNGKEIKTGDIVRIEGGYFKSDNGTFIVKHSPGDPNWNGSDYCLTKCNKKGEESNTKYSTAFWPLIVTINNREKCYAALSWKYSLLRYSSKPLLYLSIMRCLCLPNLSLPL